MQPRLRGLDEPIGSERWSARSPFTRSWTLEVVWDFESFLDTLFVFELELRPLTRLFLSESSFLLFSLPLDFEREFFDFSSLRFSEFVWSLLDKDTRLFEVGVLVRDDESPPLSSKSSLTCEICRVTNRLRCVNIARSSFASSMVGGVEQFNFEIIFNCVQTKGKSSFV